MQHSTAPDTSASAARGRAARRRRSPLHALVAATRPKQWIKNLLVIAAPGAAGVLGRDHVPLRVGVAFVAFCLLSASTYLVNDVRDLQEDRRHPRKRHRPIAAGELEPRVALIAAGALMLIGLGACLAVRPWLLAVGVAYVVSTFTYSLVWRRIPIVDVGAIAFGFVLRAVAGGVAAPVGLSRSFVLVVTFGAVFVAFGKRYAELARTRANGAATRRALAGYSVPGLRAILVASAVLAFAAYCVWALRHPTGNGIPWRLITIIPFGACLGRYSILLQRGAGEAPEELLLKDRWLLALSTAWIVVFALSVHAAS
jgi:decaprenyl-phosphate phosphoribosyltransferase